MTAPNIERRKIFQIPLLAAPLWLATHKSAIAVEDAPHEGLLSWEDFLEETTKAVESLFEDSSPSGQDRYLYSIASHAARLGEKPSTETMIGMKGAEHYTFGMAHFGKPFFVVHWRMEPNMSYPAHNHPDYAVCTLGLDGEVIVKNFETESKAPAFDSGSKEFFDVKHTKTELIGPGDMDTLSAHRNNIHYLQTGDKGAEGIDITAAYTKSSAFSFLRFEKDINSATTPGSHRAQWVGRDAALALN